MKFRTFIYRATWTLLAILLISAISLYSVNRRVVHALYKIQKFQAIVLNVSHLNLLRERYTQQPTQSSQAQWKAVYGALDTQLSTLHREDPEENILYERLQDALPRLSGYFAQIVVLESSQVDAVLPDTVQKAAIETFEIQSLTLTNQLLNEIFNLTDRSLQEMNRLLGRTLLYNRVFLALMIISLLGSMVLAIRWIIRPLEKLTRMAENIETGDYSLPRDEPRGADEVSVLTRAFMRTTGRLFNIMDNLEETVTERTSELTEAKETAELISQAKSALQATMRHELLTPINGIIGFADLLMTERHGALNEKQRRYVNNISRSGRRMLDTVTKVLDISALLSGEVELQRVAISIPDFLQSIQQHSSSAAAEKGQTLSLEVDPEVEQLQADARRLQQILDALLSNAIKFTPAGGAIKIHCRVVEGQSQEGDQPIWPSGPGLLFSVEDTGIGITPEARERLFISFTQKDALIQRLRERNGLGLVMATYLVELHGGKIWVESEGRDRGSTFKFVIPFEA